MKKILENLKSLVKVKGSWSGKEHIVLISRETSSVAVTNRSNKHLITSELNYAHLLKFSHLQYNFE